MFEGKKICPTCHGRCTVYHTHLIRFGTDDPCTHCDGKGYVLVRCDSLEAAGDLNTEFEKRRKYLSDESNEGFPAAVVGAIASRF